MKAKEIREKATEIRDGFNEFRTILKSKIEEFEKFDSYVYDKDGYTDFLDTFRKYLREVKDIMYTYHCIEDAFVSKIEYLDMQIEFYNYMESNKD